MKDLFVLFTLYFLALVSLLFPINIHAQEVTSLTIESDNTWLATRSFETDWLNTDFDDSNWGYSVAPSKGKCSLSKSLNMNFADPMWMADPKNKETVYFRKKFDINGILQEALLTSGFDDDGEIYVNGRLVRADNSKKVNPGPFIDDVKNYLEPGENVIALKVIDVQGGCQWAQVLMRLEILYEQAFQLNVPELKQTDIKWAENIYAGGHADQMFCGATIGGCGCALTSIAMVMNYFGAIKDPHGNPTSPSTLNRHFSRNMQCGKNGCTSLGYAFGAVVWPAASWYSKESSDKFGSQKIEWEGMATFNEGDVKNSVYQGKPGILKAKNQSHWIVVDGVVDSVFEDTFSVKDPLYDALRLDDEKYANTGERVAMYKKTNSDFSALYIVVSGGVQFFVTNSLGEKTGTDTTTSNIVQDIPKSSYFFEQGIYALSLIHPHKDTYTLTIVPKESEEYSVVVYASDRDAVVQQRVVESENYVGDQYYLEYDPDNVEDFKLSDSPMSLASGVVTEVGPVSPAQSSAVVENNTLSCPEQISPQPQETSSHTVVKNIVTNTEKIGVYEYFETGRSMKMGRCRELSVTIGR